MHRFLLLIFCFCYLNSTFGQQDEETNTNSEQQKIESLFDEIEEIRGKDIEKALALSKQAMQLSTAINDSLRMSKSLNFQGNLYRKVGKMEEGKELLLSSVRLSAPFGNTKELSTAYYNLGVIADIGGEEEDAIYYYESTRAVAKAMNYDKGEVLVLGALGNFYQNRGRHAESVETNLQGLELAKVLNDSNLVWSFLYNLSSVYYDINNIPSAIDFGLEAARLSRAMNNRLIIGKSIMNLGYFYLNNYQSLGDTASSFEKAENYLTEAYEILSSSKNAYWQSISGYNLGALLYTKDEYAEALKYTREAVEFQRERGYNVILSSSLQQMSNIYQEIEQLDSALHYSNLGIALGEEKSLATLSIHLRNAQIIYFQMGAYQKSIEIGKRALELAQKQNQIGVTYRSSGYLSNAYKKLNQLDKAYKYLKISMMARDTVNNTDRRIEISKLISTYEFDQEKQILEAELEKERLIKQQQAERRQLYEIAGLIGSLLVSIILVTLYHSYQRKKEDNKKLEATNRELSLMREKEKELMEATIRSKEQKLATMVMAANEKNNALVVINERLEQLSNGDADQLSKALSNIRQSVKSSIQLDSSWESFKEEFEEVHPRFFEKLKEDFEVLTQHDLKLCAYLKIDITNKEIAQVTNVTLAAVKKHLNRLKKKVGLSGEESIRAMVERY